MKKNSIIFFTFLFSFTCLLHADIVVNQKDFKLSDALKAISKDLKVKLINKIKTEKNNLKVSQYLAGDSMNLLIKLSQIYNFDWFVYGSTLTVESGVSYSNVPYKPKNISSKQLLNKINAYFKTSSAAKMITDEQGGYTIFSGTPRLLNAILDFSEMIDNNEFLEKKNNLEVSKLKFKYISVNDRSLNSNQASSNFPGAATLISHVMNDIGRFQNLNNEQMVDQAYKIKLKEGQKPQLANGTNKVQAMPSTNSLLIRGTPEEIDLAKRIAKLIDVKRRQIMFSLRVYDISSSNTEHININTSNFLSRMISENVTSSFISTMDFLQNFNALQTKGIANNVYSTNLIVLENQEGSFGKTNTTNIQFTEKIDKETIKSDIKTIQADNTIYVTGRILPSGSVNATIKYIDQRMTPSNTKESLPGISSQDLSSEIYIRPKQTVILGGFEDIHTSSSSKGIPILSDLPILGYLFKSTIDTKRKTKRYISISYKVVL